MELRVGFYEQKTEWIDWGGRHPAGEEHPRKGRPAVPRLWWGPVRTLSENREGTFVTENGEGHWPEGQLKAAPTEPQSPWDESGFHCMTWGCCRPDFGEWCILVCNSQESLCLSIWDRIQGGQGRDGGDQKGGHCHNPTGRWRHFFIPGWWPGDGENDEKVDTVVDGMDRAIR